MTKLLLSKDMNTTEIQTLDVAVYISHRACNYSPSSYGFNNMATSLGERKLCSQTC